MVQSKANFMEVTLLFNSGGFDDHNYRHDSHDRHRLLHHFFLQVADEDVQEGARDEPGVPGQPPQVMMVMFISDVQPGVHYKKMPDLQVFSNIEY